ncbi:MAG: hypothetical protein KDE09_16195 [Anaerolineales bacterium]|nr:hypothetical protein [Anaerolineales bacterium]
MAQPYYIGRQDELLRFAAMVNGEAPYTTFNIFGPGGIGKTVVGAKMQAYAAARQIPLAFVDGNQEELVPTRIMQAIVEVYSRDATLHDAFADFQRQMEEYQLVQEILQLGGGSQQIYALTGGLQDPAQFGQLLSSLHQTISTEVKELVSNRFSLERYLRSSNQLLTTTFLDGLKSAAEYNVVPLVILIDTYELIEQYDDWLQQQLAAQLPANARLVVLGRNALPQISFEWHELGPRLEAMQLAELSEPDAKQFLQYHGLADATARDKVYQFTGGYPLLLVLTVHLAREAGGWQAIDHFEHDGDRDRVATLLLERILREERVREVQTFLEKGVVARWFTPEIISAILKVDGGEARTIYQKLAQHSFVERHPHGLKFHDKIRELLEIRLKFADPAEYGRLNGILKEYYARRAGLLEETPISPVVKEIVGAPAESDEPDKASFGQLLQMYRRKTQDPKRGGMLTQKRLADFLAEEIGLIYASSTISNWERNAANITLGNRPALLGIIHIFYRLGGIKNLDEANGLLFAAGLRHLDQEESARLLRQ